MAKDKLTDYDSTASNNTDVGGISVAEGMLPSAVNNAMRELMSHQADAFGAGTPLYVDQTNNRLGVGNAAPTVPLDVTGAAAISGDLTVDTDTLHVDSTNNRVGIGIASPSSDLHIASTANPSISIEDTDNGFAASTLLVENGGRDLKITTPQDTIFVQGSSESMRIDNGGIIRIGTAGTALDSAGNEGVVLQPAGKSVIAQDGTVPLELHRSENDTTDRTVVLFRRRGSLAGSVSCTPSATSYNTSSDYRLKENVTPTWDATTRLKQLNPVRFNFIADADTTVDGFLAHEVQSVVPEAITGTKDAMMDEEYEVSAATGDIYTPAAEATFDEDGNEVTAATDEVIHSTDVESPEELAEGQQWRETTAAVMGTRSVPDYQGIDQSKLVPLLCKTILELEARITALETA